MLSSLFVVFEGKMTSVLSSDQVSAFLTHIGLPATLQAQRYQNDPVKDLHLLTQLHVHMLASCPYENLGLHYTPSRVIDINPLAAYRKIVEDARGRGGYCMELSLLYKHVLLALGFEVYTSAVRIRRRKDGVPYGEFTGWVHLVIIVTLSDASQYMVDVGFGGDGATKPLPLIESRPQRNIGTQEIRLIKDHLPTQTVRRPDTRMWIYQYRNSVAVEWNSFYAFQEVEAMEADFGVVNWFTGSNPVSPQLADLLVIKFLGRPDANGDQVIYGKRMLVNGIVKENLGEGKTQVIRTCTTEDERIVALQELFAVSLTPMEVNSIHGRNTELR